MVRKVIGWMLLLAFPMSLLAADTGVAMLYAKGPTWVNGSAVPLTAAIFPGDLVQTKQDSIANLNSTGSSVSIQADSLVKFEVAGLSLDHGSVAVATSKKLPTQAGRVRVSPDSNAWTEFQVSQNEGKVQIIARKGTVTISDDSGTTTLAAGQQTTRFAAYRDRRSGEGAVPAAGGGVLDSPIVIAVGSAGVGALVTWVLLQGGKPLSPSNP
jgi:hypothetical protein